VSDIFDDPDSLGWDDIGRINAEGYLEDAPPGQPPVFFDDQFEMRSRELQASPPGMQTVNIFPAKQGPWSGNNQLGIQQGFAPDANNFQTILKLDEWGMPEAWTICLGMEYDIEAYGAQEADLRLFDVTAVINFGSGGATQEVEIDWLNGSGITLPMNAVNVRAFYSFPSFGEGGAIGDPPADLKLRVTMCRGPMPNMRPTRSFLFIGDEDDNGFPDLLIIPTFAKEVMIAPRGDAADWYAQDGVISFVSDPTGAGSQVTIAQYTLSQLLTFFDPISLALGAPKPLPIPPFARAMTLTGDVDQRGCTVQFLLGV
jgi:hypothetical protein